MAEPILPIYTELDVQRTTFEANDEMKHICHGGFSKYPFRWTVFLEITKPSGARFLFSLRSISMYRDKRLMRYSFHDREFVALKT